MARSEMDDLDFQGHVIILMTIWVGLFLIGYVMIDRAPLSMWILLGPFFIILLVVAVKCIIGIYRYWRAGRS